MTERYKGVVVTFDRDYREDDAQAILSAIRMVRGVTSVTPVTSSIDDEMNRERIRHELFAEVRKVFFPQLFPDS